MTVLANTLPAYVSYAPQPDRAQSPVALTLFELAAGVTTNSSPSWTTPGGRAERGEQLIAEAVARARVDGTSVAHPAMTLASALIWALPSHVPLPDVLVDDDGEISFDWYEAPDRVMTITAGQSGYVGYSALLGLTPSYGRAPFAGSIPETVLFNLLRMYPASARRS